MSSTVYYINDILHYFMPLINGHKSHLYKVYGKPNIYMTAVFYSVHFSAIQTTKDP